MLGPLAVVAGEEIVEIGGARLRGLLTRLALDAGRPVSVGSLAAALWPANGPTDPAHALQSLVTRLRRALPERHAVRSVSGGYLLDIPPESVDALRFERLARDGRRALGDGEPAPFGPSIPSTVPGRAARSRPASAVVPPNRLTRPSAWIA
jgi:DNA-binding SARP family transcriptional activator